MYINMYRLGWINLLNQVTFIISDYQILSISVYTNYIIIWHFNRNWNEFEDLSMKQFCRVWLSGVIK